MDIVELERKGKTTKVNRKWLKRFVGDGWTVVGDEPVKEVDSGPKQIDLRAAIEDCDDKSELEGLMKSAKGVDLDKRKSLDNMKAEALKVLDES